MKRALRTMASVLLPVAVVVPFAHGEEYGIGPWYVVAEPERAIAVLDDPDHAWTLMVRCVEGHVDFVVRRANPGTDQPSNGRYRAWLRVDDSVPVRWHAQTWSQGGFLMLDVASMLPAMQAGRKIEFGFEDGRGSDVATFLAGHTATAFAPIRARCLFPGT